MDQSTDSAPQRLWRPKDEARELFNGRLVNRKRLAAADMLNCAPYSIGKYVRRGMPTIRVGQTVWFDPEACCSWFRAQQQSGKPRVHLVKGG